MKELGGNWGLHGDLEGSERLHLVLQTTLGAGFTSVYWSWEPD